MTDHIFSPDKPRDECGVFGISTKHQESARITFFGIFALQHRGQEAAGIAVSDGEKMHLHKGQGLVSQVFTEEKMATLTGHLSIGHTRYSTTGSSHLRNVQPMLLDTRYGPVAVAHNGNLVNAVNLRNDLFEQGVGFASSSDTEVILTMLAAARGETWLDRIANTMPKWIGAYSLLILTIDGVYAARDPWGMRPLTIGRLPAGGYAVASETGALETIGCDSVREVKPGEVIALHNQALIVRQAIPPADRQARCTFEHIYFSRPDSIWDGKVIHDVRMRLGRKLFQEKNTEGDVVIPVPDSSIPATLGYSEESGIPYNVGLLKNRYIGRTFIQPSQEMRVQDIKLKFNPIPSVLDGRRVIVIDDSIVRGSTSRWLVDIIRRAGAKEVHFRVTCPPIKHPCFMGVDMPTYEEIIAHNKTIGEIEEFIQADSLYYLSLEGMMEAVGAAEGYCNACFTGDYPFEIRSGVNKLCLESRVE